MSISSIFTNGTVPAAPAPSLGPTLNAKDPVTDPVIGDPSATFSVSDQAKRLSGRHHGGHHFDAPTAVSPAITAYQQAASEAAL